MSVQLTFAMSTDSSASMRPMLLPYEGRFDNQWIEEGEHTFLLIEVPEGGVDTFIDDVHACHPTISHVDEAALTDVGATAVTR